MKLFPNYPYVELGLSKLAKEKGFDEFTEAYYMADNTRLFRTWNSFEYKYCQFKNSMGIMAAAPTYQQLIDWFDSKEIYIQPHLIAQFELEEGWGYELLYRTKGGALSLRDEDEPFDTRIEATVDAIYNILNLL